MTDDATVPDRHDPGRRRRAGGHRGRAARRRCRRARRSGSRSTGPSTSSAAAAIDAYGVAIRPEDVTACGEADAVLLGAVGGPKWSDPTAAVRPEQALFALRGGLGPVRQPATGHGPPGARRRRRRCGPSCSTASTCSSSASSPAASTSASGARPVGRPARAQRAATRCPTPRPRSGASSALAFELARDAARPRHLRRQGQRPRDVAAVADGRRTRWPPSIPDVDARAPARRLVRDAARPPPGGLRRHRHREPVRRHPLGRGGGAGGEPGDAAVRVARRAADRPRHVRALRAHPRVRAGHRRPRHREPDRHDPVGGDAAADVARATRPRPRRSRRPSRARSTTAGGPATWPIRRTRTTASSWSARPRSRPR